MTDYADKSYLHPRLSWRYAVEIILVLAIWIGAYALASYNDERIALMDRESLAMALCIPAFADEVAAISSINGRFECVIKRGHQVVARFEV